MLVACSAISLNKSVVVNIYECSVKATDSQ